MKKFFGATFSFLAFVCMTAALTLPAMGLMHWLFESGKLESIAQIFEDQWILFGVCAGAAAILVLLGTIINTKLGGASYVMSPIFGLGAYGALLYVVMWGPAKDTLSPVLPMIESIELDNATIFYIGIGIMAFGLVLSALGRALYRSGKKGARGRALRETYAEEPTSRESDLTVASSRSPRIERYVRDPWGNLIREEDYNERINQSRTRKL